MKQQSYFRRFFVMTFLGLMWALPLKKGEAVAQQSSDLDASNLGVAEYHRLRFHMLSSKVPGATSLPEDLEYVPLSKQEEDIARNLNSPWAWPEHTLEMIDSYSRFLFRTKKSRDLDQVRVLLHVDSKGKVAGFEPLDAVDKGTKERLDYLIRKLPSCKPVPGYGSYGPADFELTIKK